MFCLSFRLFSGRRDLHREMACFILRLVPQKKRLAQRDATFHPFCARVYASCGNHLTHYCCVPWFRARPPTPRRTLFFFFLVGSGVGDTLKTGSWLCVGGGWHTQNCFRLSWCRRPATAFACTPTPAGWRTTWTRAQRTPCRSSCRWTRWALILVKGGPKWSREPITCTKTCYYIDIAVFLLLVSIFGTG